VVFKQSGLAETGAVRRLSGLLRTDVFEEIKEKAQILCFFI
jgi:hypothetical protein